MDDKDLIAELAAALDKCLVALQTMRPLAIAAAIKAAKDALEKARG